MPPALIAPPPRTDGLPPPGPPLRAAAPPAPHALGLDDDRTAAPGRDLGRLRRVAREPVLGDRDARPPDDLARLVLVEPHRPPRVGSVASEFGRRTLPRNTNVHLSY